jgi:hypothetical protein
MKVMFRYQEARLGVITAWILAPLWGMMLFFYLGTIWATPSIIDLRARDIEYGFLTGLVGLLVGIVFAICVTIFYPPAINRQRRIEEEAEMRH